MSILKVIDFQSVTSKNAAKMCLYYDNNGNGEFIYVSLH